MSKNRTERWNRKLRVALVLTLSLLAIHLTRTQSRSQGTLKYPPPSIRARVRSARERPPARPSLGIGHKKAPRTSIRGAIL